MIAAGAKNANQKFLGILAIVCLGAMILEPIGTNLLPESEFGLFERFSTFSAVIINAILGMYLFTGKFDSQNEIGRRVRNEKS